MSTIITRISGPEAKGDTLTFAELDTNFINLNTDKYESGDDVTFNIITANTLSVSESVDSPVINVVSLSVSGDVTFPVNSISVDSLVQGDTFLDFRSVGIDDNATNTAIFIDSENNTYIGFSSNGVNLQVNQDIDGETAQRWQSSAATLDLKTAALNNVADPFVWDTTSSFAWAVDGTEAVRIGTTGLVGIGETTPSVRLEVSGPGTDWSASAPETGSTAVFHHQTANAVVGISSSATSYSKLNFGDTNSPNIGSIEYNHATDEMSFVSNNAVSLFIDNTGQIGVGKVAPNFTLDVAGSVNVDSSLYVENAMFVNNAINYTGSTDTFFIRNRFNGGIVSIGTETAGGTLYYPIVMNGTNDSLEFKNATSTVMFMDTDGNVGIGATDPTYRLDVSGEVAVNSQYLFDSQTTTLTTITPTPVATYDAATFAGSKLVIQVIRGTERHMTELLVTHDGTTATSTEYATIFTGASALATFSVDISGGSLRLIATSASATSTEYNVAKTLMMA